MLYHLPHHLQGSADTITAELSRLAQHAGRVPITTIHVGPPYRKTADSATLIEVPDALHTLFEERIVPVLVGPDVSGVNEIAPITLLPEWTHQAQLRPTVDAQPLDATVLAEWTSVCLTLEWMPGKCRGIVRYCAEDVPRLEQLKTRGWIVTPRPKPLIHVWLGSCATTLQPTLGLSGTHVPQIQAPLPEQTSGAVSAKSLHAAPASPLPHGSVLADADAPGLRLGTTSDGRSVRLA
ncbi:MAG TPA: hypothetical protein VFZ66_23020 [Herpetosiphonaceae bacterium]